MEEKNGLMITELQETDECESESQEMARTTKLSIRDRLRNAKPAVKKALPYVGVVGGIGALVGAYFFGRSQKGSEIIAACSEIAEKNDKITKLVELCEEKDSFMNEVMSDGLRHGSPKAAQQMAFKKHSA